jgi:cell wall-associated NlpC family hydrolase
MKRRTTLAVALIAAPFLFLIMVILLLFGGASIDTDDTESRSLTGGRPLNQLAVPAWAYNLLLAAAQTCPDITAPLLAAQLETESNWNPNAHNAGSGADGLAQFIPTTWATWSRDGDGDGKADPRNPADAIPAQAAYMCHLVDFVKQHPNLTGDIIALALAAYNAGPGNVQKYGGIPPFLETTNYVHKIRQLVNTRYSDIAPAASINGAVEAARRWIGTPYAWGGGTLNGPSEGMPPDTGITGFDCSGLVRYAIYQASAGTITLPRTSQAQYNATKSQSVSLDNLQPGDLLFWGGSNSVHHVAIYSGDGKMIEAPRSGQTIRETGLRTGGDFLGATRIIAHLQ